MTSSRGACLFDIVVGRVYVHLANDFNLQKTELSLGGFSILLNYELRLGYVSPYPFGDKVNSYAIELI